MGGESSRSKSTWLARNAGLIVLVGACVGAIAAWRWCFAPGERAQPKVPTATPTDDIDLLALLHDGGVAHEMPSDLLAARAGITYVARAEERDVVATPAPSGAPTTLMHLPEPAWGMAVDDAAVWVTSTRGKDGVLEKLALAGRAEPVVVAGGFARPRAVASDGTSVFLVDTGGETGGLLRKSSIVRVPAAGGDAVKIATVEGVVSSLALDRTNVYWADSLDGALLSAPKTGGMPQALLHDRGLPRDVVVDGDALVWVEQRSESLWTVPSAGGAPRQLVQDFAGFAHLVAGARGVYWTNEAALDGTYRVFLFAHGASEPVPVTPAVDAIDALASDGARIYWLRHGTADEIR